VTLVVAVALELLSGGWHPASINIRAEHEARTREEYFGNAIMILRKTPGYLVADFTLSLIIKSGQGTSPAPVICGVR
jgi:hypothetical protein